MSFVAPRIMAWSYSRLKTWEQCPLKAKLKFVQRLKEPDSIYADRGTEIHKHADAFIAGETPKDTLSKVVKFYEPFLAATADDKMVRTELQQGLTKDWKFTDWFGPTTWLRVIYDIHMKKGARVDIRDTKTGKIYEDEHEDQRDLYATSAFADETVEEVHVGMIYVDQGTQSKLKVMTRTQFRERRAYWDDRAAPMLADDIFAPRPNDKCKWCHFRKTNGGPCQFS